MSDGSAVLGDLPSRVPGIVIIGAGIAGLFAALKLAPQPVTVISPVPLGEGASSTWAQGGIAAAVGLVDTPEAHARDTAAAGAGLVDLPLALGVAREAGDRVRDLLAFGVPFDRDPDGVFVQSREAAHSANRVVRVTGDQAGAAIMAALISAARAADHITVLEGYSVDNLERADDGIFALTLTSLSDQADRRTLSEARHVLLATGGVGGLYRETTNPSSSTGRGIALAARVGAVIADCEFVQFHPTAIATGAASTTDALAPVPLASEALRGEGAILSNADGTRFMRDKHRDAELGPRDVVARAVHAEVQSGRGAFLDCREAIGAAFPKAFPTIYAKCKAAMLDPVMDPIPVRPAEHYHMGGIKTDDAGETTIENLWAIGEVAATGLHGANRLASNSLLEAVVFADRAAVSIKARTASGSAPTGTIDQRPITLESAVDPELARAAQIAIRAIMADDVGVIRDREGLTRALGALSDIQSAANGQHDIENMAIAARFIAESALRRKESRGAHHRSDFETTDTGEPRRITMTLAGLDLRRSITSGALLTDLMQAEEVSND